jgi:hypothetical protein
MSSGSLRLSDLGLSDNPTRPVIFALSRAFVENWNAFLATSIQAAALAGPGIVGEEEIVRVVQKALGFLQKAYELSGWVYSEGRPLPFAEALSKAQWLKKLGADPDHVEAIFSGLQKRHVGRPHRRQSFINAFEFQVRSKKNSQGQATQKFCPCGEKIHTAKCEQNLRAGLRSLKKVLRKYAPELVSKYELLHPDRAKKVNG